MLAGDVSTARHHLHPVDAHLPARLVRKTSHTSGRGSARVKVAPAGAVKPASRKLSHPARPGVILRAGLPGQPRRWPPTPPPPPELS